MSLKEIIRQHAGRLTPADRRLVDALLENPAGAAMSSASDIAQRAGVHAASLVRLARKLGFEGFADLRARLQADILAGEQPHDRLRKRVQDLPPDQVLQAVMERERAFLRDLPNHVSQEQIARAARLIADGHRILLFAEGSSRLLRDMMARRLRRVGRPVEVLEAQSRDLAEGLNTLAGTDVLMAFAFSAVPPLLPPVLEEAARCGAASILVADLIGPLVRPAPDLLLSAPRGVAGESQSLTIPMALCTSILLTLPLVDGGASIRAVERYGILRRQMEDKTR